MSLTLAALEAELMVRCAGRIDRARPGWTRGDASCRADSTPRTYLAGPLVAGAKAAGIATASPLELTDADLESDAGAHDAHAAKLLDVAELRVLENVLGNWDRPNETSGPDGQQWGALASDLRQAIEAKRAWLKTQYGIGLGTLTAGTIDLGFARTSCRVRRTC